MSDETVPVSPAPAVRKIKPWMWVVGGAVLVVAVLIILGVVVTNAHQPKSFASAIEECGVSSGGSVQLLDGGKSMSIDGKGEESDGLGIEKMACIFIALDLPQATISRMDTTRALDGRQKDVLPDYTVEWSYHPDNGLDVLFTR
ncbi:hypothetical protein [uncultured Microbacterium sp.]|uniref:hypothetical protein n=1 Tax=uncultured Microbacterium sp. TaxID=191216 RepID=UPI0025EF95E3|nr:hypothetical protein [uncultured Microbacterium sp.]